MKIIDLSHQIKEDMTTYSFIPKPKIGSLFTHEESKQKYGGAVTFEISKVDMFTSIGTYMDSPFHRHPDRKKISDIEIIETIGNGIILDVSNKEAKSKISLKDFDSVDLTNKEIILFYTGWDKYWNSEQYFESPSLDYDAVDFLVSMKPKIVGIDGINVDHSTHKDKPAHTKLLENNILIVENLANLQELVDKQFTFYATPLNIKDMAAFPVRAFATIS